ncbi:hypothetical protein [Archangium lipolyticum]|uniref:hypothetical protein n=1 Tax=Archangium lipolyticum TaxID=2970465 RepID=UPI00214A5D60|nr:hypothetical protein [Archangium lipolyticum]
MSIYDSLVSASRFAASRWRAARAGDGEEAQLWRHVDEYRAFLGETGQVYLFEDYLKGVAPRQRPLVSTALETRQDAVASKRAMELLLKAFDETPEPEQKQAASTLIHLLNFIADTGQLDDFEDFVNNRLENAPLAIAHFTTRDEAQAWLKGLAKPPSPARILIGDEYYLAWSSREDNARDMYRDYIIEPYIGELVAGGIPSTAPSFETRGEAEAWLKEHPASPFGFVSIAGEYFFAVHHKRLKRHTLHPVASALTKWEEMKRAAEREEARDAVAKDEGDGE